MSKRFLTPPNLPSGSSLPSSGIAGDLFFKSDEAKIYVHDGTQWVIAQGSGGGGGGVTVSATPPVSPSEGDYWFDSTTTKSYIYYDSFWVEVGYTGGGYIISETAPTDPSEGDVWFSSSEGVIYVYYDNYWVDPSTGGAAGVPSGGTTGQVLSKASGDDYNTEWSTLTAAGVSYDNSAAELNATTVKGALDELSLSKANVADLSTNLNVYATTATSDISGYNVLVSNIDDADYNDVAVNVGTGAITADNQLIASLAAPADLFSGVVGPINVTTIGNIRKTAGNNNKFASFYFEVYKRAANGTETLVGTSDNTGDINPETSDYQEFNATAFTQFGTVLDTDRVVIKYYANLTGNSGAEYDFQFGGSSPVRTLIPVPASVIVTHIAQEVLTDTTNFDGILSASDTTVQAALETLDDLSIATSVEELTDVVLTSVADGETLIYDAANIQWINGAAGSSTTVSTTAPSSPAEGDNWFNSETGQSFIYYDSYWVELGVGPAGPQGPAGDPYGNIDGGNAASTYGGLLSITGGSASSF